MKFPDGVWKGLVGVSGIFSKEGEGVTAGKLAEDRVREHIGEVVAVGEVVG